MIGPSRKVYKYACVVTLQIAEGMVKGPEGCIRHCGWLPMENAEGE